MRFLGVLFTVLFACAVAVITFPAFFRVEQVFPITQIVAMRGLIVVGLAALTVLFLLLAAARPIRGFALSMALVAALGSISSGVMLGARGYGEDTLPEATDTSVRVMSWNTAGEATGAYRIAQTAVAMDADIVALPETTEDGGEQVALEMRELGRPMWVHHVAYNDSDQPTPYAWETTLLISPDLGDYSVIESSEDGSSNTTTVPSAVAMPVDGDGPTVVAVHAVAPRQSYMDRWSNDLQWIADQCPEGNVIMAGDFNATLEHMAGLGVGDHDLGYCDDAASRSGNGAIGTWPTDVPELLGAPIDHVMHTDAWRTTGSIVLTNLDDAGSDHRPVVVQLEPAG
ncbi:endonuclease/exonuclease/phosphatase family protein [Microbacterium halophytorum]|uniref:endonuclease/exonuclease/phosphatase family protein n=1 Tax=Microbacterium halophytorum TaxID=2067568 RepID=UPI000CFBD7D6|nr:endonuclease/exonuclease/phosphatase family protein [Microbacterium halophytorum]